MAELGHIAWWQWIPLWPWRIVATVEAADEIPEQLPRNGAVFVGSANHPKWLAFDCPCGTGHRIMITLDTGHRPHWTITTRRRLTVSPSVDYSVPAMRCHYVISRGRIQWARDRKRR